MVFPIRKSGLLIRKSYSLYQKSGYPILSDLPLMRKLSFLHPGTSCKWDMKALQGGLQGGEGRLLGGGQGVEVGNTYMVKVKYLRTLETRQRRQCSTVLWEWWWIWLFLVVRLREETFAFLEAIRRDGRLMRFKGKKSFQHTMRVMGF